MATGGIRLSGDWSDLLRSLDPEVFEKRLARGLVVAHSRIGRDFQREARGRIRAGVYTPNSPITIAIKGSSKPLVATGQLQQGIGFEVASPLLLRLGVLRSAVGDEVVNIGAVVHEGGVVDLDKHPKVRAAMWAKVGKSVSPERLAKLRGASRTAVVGAAAAIGRAPKARKLTGRQAKAFFGKLKREGKLASTGGGGGKRIVIPPRRYITSVVELASFRDGALRHYEEAIRVAFGIRGG